jgi:alkylation response protein AidB-like acyl-CoA dehydrogenase
MGLQDKRCVCPAGCWEKMTMDFSWSEEQLIYRQAVIDFAEKELNAEIIEDDRQGSFPRQKWLKCARYGIQGLSFPEEYGGAEADILTTMLTMEGLGYACRDNGLIFAINAQMWSVQMPIFSFGTEEQKRKYLPGLCKGDLIGAHGMSEPDSGSDA